MILTYYGDTNFAVKITSINGDIILFYPQNENEENYELTHNDFEIIKTFYLQLSKSIKYRYFIYTKKCTIYENDSEELTKIWIEVSKETFKEQILL